MAAVVPERASVRRRSQAFKARSPSVRMPEMLGRTVAANYVPAYGQHEKISIGFIGYCNRIQHDTAKAHKKTICILPHRPSKPYGKYIYYRPEATHKGHSKGKGPLSIKLWCHYILWCLCLASKIFRIRLNKDLVCTHVFFY